MKKFLAEAIAAFIPHKPTRNRLRGVLRFGVGNAIRLRRRLRNTDNLREPEIKLAICAIAKDEGRYLAEWIEWHLAVGVERFYFYDNGSTDDTRNVLKPFIDRGIVDYTYFPGYRKQIAAYDDCFARHRFEAEWIAFIDIDEFIVPTAPDGLIDFLDSHREAAAVEVNWLCYGSSGHVESSTEPVMKRFRRHARADHPLNRFVKTIVNPRKVYGMIGCHEAARIDGSTIDTHGNAVKRHFKDREPLHDVLRVNHYAVKSRQEFVDKQNRGRASGKRRDVPEEYFTRYDLNDITD